MIFRFCLTTISAAAKTWLENHYGEDVKVSIIDFEYNDFPYHPGDEIADLIGDNDSREIVVCAVEVEGSEDTLGAIHYSLADSFPDVKLIKQVYDGEGRFVEYREVYAVPTAWSVVTFNLIPSTPKGVQK